MRLVSKVIYKLPWSMNMLFVFVVFMAADLFSSYGYDPLISVCILLVLSILIVCSVVMMIGADDTNRSKKYRKEFFVYTIIFLLGNLPLLFVITFQWILLHLPGKAASVWVELSGWGILVGLLALQIIYSQVYVFGSFFIQKGEGLFSSIKKGVIFAFNNVPALLILSVWGIIMGGIVAACIQFAADISLFFLSLIFSDIYLKIVENHALSFGVYTMEMLLDIFFLTLMMSFLIAPFHVLFKRREQAGSI